MKLGDQKFIGYSSSTPYILKMYLPSDNNTIDNVQI